MNQTIIQAIKEKRLLYFTYDEHNRVVEPHTYGISNKGNESLSAFQVRGDHVSNKPHDWHFFTVFKMVGLTMLQDEFATHRNGYKRGDSRMTTIFCEL